MKHPRWPVTGWLAHWMCPYCSQYDYEVVTAAQVAQWGKDLGGWGKA